MRKTKIFDSLFIENNNVLVEFWLRFFFFFSLFYPSPPSYFMLTHQLVLENSVFEPELSLIKVGHHKYLCFKCYTVTVLGGRICMKAPIFSHCSRTSESLTVFRAEYAWKHRYFPAAWKHRYFPAVPIFANVHELVTVLGGRISTKAPIFCRCSR